MQIKHFLTAASAAFMVATTATANADDGYDAPESWPSPMQEHNMGMALFDRLEYSVPDKGQDAIVWDFQGWYGGDVNRVYIKSEGENVQGDGEDAEFESLELLYSRLIADFWELQGGVGYQGGVFSDDHAERTYGVVGLQGVMPYGIETDVALQLSEDGDLAASFEGEYDLRLTQRLYLQPRTEIAMAANEVKEFGVGEGLNSVRVGMRLGYEVTRRVAPYVGAYWEKEYGDTADFSRAGGDRTEDTGVVAGVRLIL
ncbi:copper resistance protein B [Chromohalobacter canadensis]|uniref:copper resistance protein B n=1 Tax=Chromohalobacter canadensis TaxID=141389 RepID=UPI0021BF0D40|nr:copper resistance protein B [Chromohalobacter canadensis]MCT8469205.1 copper resistance protein B [Chromohalobacter canadensis]MCT8472605.1 copper resistance protein B [Chromohalobacter canadensis]MCT8500058.1 copper resistance protein B [Chromohalobacter canadensis]